MNNFDTELIITRMISEKMLELEAKGFTPSQADGAIKRARNWSERIAKNIQPSRRDAAFLDLFESQLNQCETWLLQVRKSKDNWKDGIETFIGGQIGPQTEAAYQEWSA